MTDWHIGPAHPAYPRTAHDTGQSCQCVSGHRPAPLEFERHHVWPLGMGGPDAEWNLEWLCPTAHTNTHELLRLMVRDGRVHSMSELSARYEPPVNRWSHHLAVVGWERWQANLRGDNPQAVRLANPHTINEEDA